MIHKEIAASNYSALSTVSYRPDTPGVFSLVLEVADQANNSIFVRQIFMFDPVSNITINDNSEFYVSSANNATEYQWQTNTLPIEVTWRNHFTNSLHDNGGFLNKVEKFPEETLETGHSSKSERVVKSVEDAYDDKDGRRRLVAVPNAHGIVAFHYAYMVDHMGGSTIQLTPNDSQFMSILEPEAESHVFPANTSDGYSMRIWVRALDIMGNQRDDELLLHFDSSPPVILNVTMERNIDNGTFPFSSR